MRNRLLTAILAAMLGLGLVACSDAADDPAGTDPAIEGESDINDGGLPPTDDALTDPGLDGTGTDDTMTDETSTEGS